MAATSWGVAAMARLEIGRAALGGSPAEMLEGGLTEAEFRGCFGEAAKGKAAWFKRIDLGETLGETIAADSSVEETDLGHKLAAVEAWCYGE